MLADGHKENLKHIVYQGFFREKSIVSCFWFSNVLWTHNILLKSLESFLRKSIFFIFFSCELPLILGVGGKLNKRYGHTAHTFSRLMPNVLIWERFIPISSGFQTTDNNTVHFLGGLSCWFNNIATKKFIMFVTQFVSCFFCELPLILRVGRKWKKLQIFARRP